MSLGERAALVGLLQVARPRLAIEIGTLTGGSLDAIASVADAVHSFDLEPLVDQSSYPNVTFHVGDSHLLLPEALAALTVEGRNVDFVLVDGDHSEDGVLADITDLLSSDAVGRSVVVLHDVAHETVRAGLRRVEWTRFPKVRHVEIDAVPGRLLRGGESAGMWWGGLGLILVDVDGERFGQGEAPPESLAETLGPEVRPEELEVALAAARRDADRLRHDIVALRSSRSWRATATLRRMGDVARDVLRPRSR